MFTPGSLTARAMKLREGSLSRWLRVSLSARHRFLRLCLLAGTVTPAGLSAQAASPLVVIVTDAAGRPVPDALVSIANTAEVRTDTLGSAAIRPPRGEFTLTVRKVGFVEARNRVPPAASRSAEIRVQLIAVQRLAPVRVVGERRLPAELERRRQERRGTFYGPEELATAPNLKSLLGRTRGVAIDGTGDFLLRMRHPAQGGDCWADVYIDGVLTAPYVKSFNEPRSRARLKYEELSMLPPSHVYAMEIYPRASQAPPSVVGVRDGCGVILVWTEPYAYHQLRAQELRERAEANRRNVDSATTPGQP